MNLQELHVNKTVSTAADVFSLGALIYFIYANGVSLIPDGTNCVAGYTKELDMVKQKIEEKLERSIHPTIRDAILRMCSRDVPRRPTFQLFTLIKYFDDTGASALRQLDDLQRLDASQKAHFLCCSLKESLPFIPEDLWITRVLPLVEKEMTNAEELSGAAVRPMLYMMEHCCLQNLSVFQRFIARIILNVCNDQNNHPMLTEAVLENLGVIFERISDKELLQNLLNLCISSITSGSSSHQISALNSLPKIRKSLSHSFFSDKLLPAMEMSLLSCESDGKSLGIPKKLH